MRILDDDVDDSAYFYDWDAPRPNSKSANSIWTDENVEILIKMWNEDVVTRVIAETLGTTRNAVIGKADRLCLPRRERMDFCVAPPSPSLLRKIGKPKLNRGKQRVQKKKMIEVVYDQAA